MNTYFKDFKETRITYVVYFGRNIKKVKNDKMRGESCLKRKVVKG